MIEGIDPHQTGARILDIECDENRPNTKRACDKHGREQSTGRSRCNQIGSRRCRQRDLFRADCLINL